MKNQAQQKLVSLQTSNHSFRKHTQRRKERDAKLPWPDRTHTPWVHIASPARGKAVKDQVSGIPLLQATTCIWTSS